MNGIKKYGYLAIATALAACGGANDTAEAPANKTVIKGTIDGGASKTIYFENFVNNQPNKVDSATIGTDGSYAIYTNHPVTDFYRISLSNEDFAVLILDSTQTKEVAVNATAGNMLRSYEVEGSSDSKVLKQFYIQADQFASLKDSMQTLFNNMPLEPTPERDSLIAYFQQRQAEFYQYNKNFIDQNVGSPACLSALSHLNIQQDFDYFKKVQESLKAKMGHSIYVNQLTAQVKMVEQQMEQQRLMAEQQAAMDKKLAVGTVAPEIKMADPNGNEVALSSLRGKTVLIDFWASWCKPCRAESPNLVRVYNQYRTKGFEIYSVSLDRTQDRWVQAIEQDGLAWTHVSDLGFWNSAAAQLYGVRSIPFTVLIDEEGKIIAKNLRGAALEEKLKEIF